MSTVTSLALDEYFLRLAKDARFAWAESLMVEDIKEATEWYNLWHQITQEIDEHNNA